ncbi:MAG: hypothetical protein IT204_02915 [Fimbriimonadaceae bacterium]|nr:hypothetical protein [Fimbriimonadaceae bacterium]
MTGRQRVLAAFDHVEPDRVPFFEQAFASDVASALLGRPAATGTTLLHYEEAAAWMRGEAAHAQWVEQCYDDVIAIARHTQQDMICPPWRRPQRPTRQTDTYDFLYGDPAGLWDLWRYNPDSKTFYLVQTNRRSSAEPDDLAAHVAQVEQAAASASVPALDPQDWHLRLQRDCPDLLVPAPGALVIPLQPVWLMACRLRPDLVARWLDAMCDLAIRSATAWAAAGFTIVWGGGDFADNHGPTYGPQVFRELVLPRVQRYVAALHRLGMRYVYRTDGNLECIADEFFRQSGIDGYGEIDYDAGMRIPDLQPRYGDTVTFWGDVPCGSLLHRGSAAEVADFVGRRLQQCRGRGGWILGSSNSIVPGTPPANVMAMVAALHAG